jgi:hypothetical protein
MKLNLNWNIKDLAGKDIPNANAGKTLAQSLAGQNKGNSVKLYDWSIKLWNDKPLEIDDTDSDVLMAMIDTSELLTILSKAQIIEYIKKVKEKTDKK